MCKILWNKPLSFSSNVAWWKWQRLLLHDFSWVIHNPLKTSSYPIFSLIVLSPLHLAFSIAFFPRSPLPILNQRFHFPQSFVLLLQIIVASSFISICFLFWLFQHCLPIMIASLSHHDCLTYHSCMPPLCENGGSMLLQNEGVLDAKRRPSFLYTKAFVIVEMTVGDGWCAVFDAFSVRVMMNLALDASGGRFAWKETIEATVWSSLAFTTCCWRPMRMFLLKKTYWDFHWYRLELVAHFFHYRKKNCRGSVFLVFKLYFYNSYRWIILVTSGYVHFRYGKMMGCFWCSETIGRISMKGMEYGGNTKKNN